MTVFDEMLSRYPGQDLWQRHQALHEIIQQVTLAGLHRGGFFDHAAFYGGTCLRIFYGMPRFSENMDFSLLEKRDDIHLEHYFRDIVEEFHLLGREVVITQKKKANPGAVESAFLKDDTEIYDIGFRGDKVIKVKLELDTHPPLKFQTEQKLLMQPYSFMTRCFTLPNLFAGKMHALIYRHWLKRVKGRDWYDFEWYIRRGVPLNFTHLRERVFDFNQEWLSREDFMRKLRERLSQTSIAEVKKDVLPFIKDPHELDIWSNEYFLMLADQLKISEDDPSR